MGPDCRLQTAADPSPWRLAQVVRTGPGVPLQRTHQGGWAWMALAHTLFLDIMGFVAKGLKEGGNPGL